MATSLHTSSPTGLDDEMSPPATADPSAPNDGEKKKEWRIPLLRLRVNDVSSDGSAAFFQHMNATTLLREAVVGVLEGLYTPETVPPGVRSVTLVLRSMGGIAYTTGSEIDDDHKEIHFSTDYIAGLPAERVKHEILGVVRHEMVHCWQYNALGTCPGGLIEGIADYVRLKDGLAPPHWSRGGKHWDEGYQVTAYFLEWCDQKFGGGFVKSLNGSFKDTKYSPKVWSDLSGTSVQELWKEYKKQFALQTHDGTDDSDYSGDGDEDHHEDARGESSEDESVDVVGREEANEDVADENKLGLEQESTSDWLPEEKEALFLRHRLQRTFLPSNGETPNVDEFPDADTYFTFLESMEDVPTSILLKSKLPKVLRLISRLEHPEVTQSQFNFKPRARALVEKWGVMLPRETGEDSPTSPIQPLRKGEEGINLLSSLDPSLRRTVLLEQNNDMLQRLPVDIQNETNELRRQAGLSPIPLEDRGQHNQALVHLHHLSSRYDGASDISASDGESETEYEHSYVSTTHESTIVSCASSNAETDSQTSDTVLSHSRGSTPRGGAHDMARRPLPNETHELETSSTSSSSTSTWNSPSNSSQISMIASKKLASLKFSGDVDGARFIKEFEKLVDRVQPDMSDDDKRMLLTTSFTGQAVNVWYEELDVDDSMPYEELKVAFIDAFKGMSRRSKKLDGGALLDP